MTDFDAAAHPREDPTHKGRFTVAHNSLPEDALPAPARVVDRALLRSVRALEDDPGGRFPGAHPEFGGLNWGVQFSDHWGDWGVNHGLWGSSHESCGEVYIDNSKTPLPADTTRWSSDVSTPEEAAELWTVRDDVTAGLVAQGRTPKEQVRVRTTFTDDGILIGTYDWPNDFVPFTVPRAAQP